MLSAARCRFARVCAFSWIRPPPAVGRRVLAPQCPWFALPASGVPAQPQVRISDRCRFARRARTWYGEDGAFRAGCDSRPAVRSFGGQARERCPALVRPTRQQTRCETGADGRVRMEEGGNGICRGWSRACVQHARHPCGCDRFWNDQAPWAGPRALLLYPSRVIGSSAPDRPGDVACSRVSSKRWGRCAT